MEYAAIFVLFVLTAAAAMRLAINGKGAKEAVFLVALIAFMCVEPWGKNVKVAPSVILLSVAGAVSVLKSGDVTALLGALCVSAATVCGTGHTLTQTSGFPWITAGSVMLCALVCRGARAGTVFALGVTAGEMYIFFSDRSAAFYLNLFSVQTAYAAIVCAVVAKFFAAVSSICFFAKSRKSRGCLNRPLFTV